MTDTRSGPAAGTDPAPWLALAEAMFALAGRCDGARTDDGEGFNAGDVPLGHYLADLPPAQYDEIAAIGAWQIARTYQTQLASLVIAFAELPVPPKHEMYVREILTLRRQQAKLAAQIAAASFAVLETEDGNTVIVLGFPYEPGMVAGARAIPGRAYRDTFGKRRKVNLYPASSAAAVSAFCEKHDIPISPDLHALAANPPAPEPEAPKGPNITISAKGAKIEVRFDAFPTTAQREAVRSLPGRKWDEVRKIWTAPHTRRVLLALPAVAERAGLRLAQNLAEAAAFEAERAAWNLTASAALRPTAGPLHVPGLAGALKDHQHAGLEFIERNRRVLIGDRMGLGKTLLSLAAIARDEALPAVVVCKTSLRLNWLAEIETFFPAVRTYVAEGIEPEQIPADTQIIIIGFDVLKATRTVKYADERGNKRSKQAPGWLPAILERHPKALIIDESHFGKEAGSQRAQAMETLGQNVADRDGMVLALTGTAIVNRPLELIQQLKILGRLEEFGQEWEFKNRYCAPVFNMWGADYTGASNETELHQKLRATGIYLRRGQEALTLPTLTIRPTQLEPEELDRAAMAAYYEAERDFMTMVLARAGQRGIEVTDPKARAVFVANVLTAEALVKLNLLRELAGAAKAAATIRRVADLVHDGEKVMIAAHHRGVIAEFADAFGHLRIQGGQSTASVEADKAAFQTLPVETAPVITVSTAAGGVGHTLTAAARGVMAELPWTWAEIDQMAARMHRIGQDRAVDFQVVLAPGTVDEFMWETVSLKQQITSAVLDGEQARADSELGVAAAVVERMLAAHAEHIAETSLPKRAAATT